MLSELSFIAVKLFFLILGVNAVAPILSIIVRFILHV